MGNAEQPVLIYTTFGSLEEAKDVGAALVAARLAACVNMFPGMISLYQWDGAGEETNEVAMIIKTRSGLTDQVLGAQARDEQKLCAFHRSRDHEHPRHSVR